MPDEISVPFRLDGNGRVVTTDDPDAQVRLHVLALLNTTPAERAMVPGYGTDLLGLLFSSDPSGDDVAAQATLRIRNSMKMYEPGVDLISATAEPSEDDNMSVIDVQYRRLDAPDSSSVANTNTAIIGANGVVREVVRG